jgi:hypothetical protein
MSSGSTPQVRMHPMHWNLGTFTRSVLFIDR